MHVRGRREGGLVAVAVAGVIVAGCGGNGVSAQDFREQANAVCAEGDRRVERLGPANLRRDTDEAKVFRKVQGVLAAAVVKLEAVNAPDRDRGGYRDMVAAYRLGAAKTGRLAAALAAGNRRAIALAASEYTTAIGEAQTHARELGLAECDRFGLPAGY